MRRSRRYVVASVVIGALLAALAVLWAAIHTLPWFGPWLADTGRSLLGGRAVSTVEDWAYAIDNAWNRWWRSGARPQSHWTAPPASPSTTASATRVAVAPVFRPSDVGPVFETFAAAGDGSWVSVPDPRRPDDAPLMYKTLLHPDDRRACAELFVVAVDRTQVRLHFAPGTIDPEATTPEGRAQTRTGLIPAEDRPNLLVAFNGGFKTEHGHFGMRVDGVTFIASREDCCTVASYEDDTLRIASWTALAPDEPRMVWWRQTPPCMIEGGVLHPGLRADATTRWGAAVGGETVIRRSAIGLSQTGDVLYVGVSESTTARAIAIDMGHAGARTVAQDVNWSYPKFLVFRTAQSGLLDAVGLFPGFVFQSDEYVRRAAPKDFFYLVRR